MLEVARMKFSSTRLKALRESKNMSQEQLGQLVGVKRQQIDSWEKDKHSPSIGALGKMATALNVPASFLIEDAPSP